MDFKPFSVPDLRDPDAPMATLALKLPAVVLDALQSRAATLRCGRGTLARALIVAGLGCMGKINNSEVIEADRTEVA